MLESQHENNISLKPDTFEGLITNIDDHIYLENMSEFFSTPSSSVEYSFPPGIEERWPI